MGCEHSVQLHGLCALCGLDLAALEYGFEEKTSNEPVHILHANAGLKVSRGEAEKLERENAKRLRTEKRLSLVLDLDQTVLHATVDTQVQTWLDDTKHPNHPAVKDVQRIALVDSFYAYYIKFRPGLASFLRKASQMYEMHVYTMGSRTYAHAIVELMEAEYAAREPSKPEPSGDEFEQKNGDARSTRSLFADRILSRDDNGLLGEEARKDISRLFPCDSSMVVVLDDRADIWQHSPNLIRVTPYVFFTGIGDVNSPTRIASNDQEGTKIIESDKDAGVQEKVDAPALKDDDSELQTIERILVELHRRYYTESSAHPSASPDVKNILANIRRLVLKDCCIAFSGLVPLGADPKTFELWRLAEYFGAECIENIEDPGHDPSCTHLVTIRRDTLKALFASKADIKIVRPEWLIESAKKWTRLNEDFYGIQMPEPVVNATKDLSDSQQAKTTKEPARTLDLAELEEMDRELEDFLDTDLSSESPGDEDSEAEEDSDRSSCSIASSFTSASSKSQEGQSTSDSWQKRKRKRLTNPFDEEILDNGDQETDDFHFTTSSLNSLLDLTEADHDSSAIWTQSQRTVTPTSELSEDQFLRELEEGLT